MITPERPVLGYLIRPHNGARMAILSLKNSDQIQVRGGHIEFETSIQSALNNGYLMEAHTPELQAAWDLARAAQEKVLQNG